MAGNLIDYGKVTEAYWTSLNTVLRGFQPAAEFLELWVPDEDHVKSIINMIESVQIVGQEKLSLFLSRDILAQINLDDLKEKAARYGAVTLEDSEDGMVMDVTLTA
jgi:hypothetical protein